MNLDKIKSKLAEFEAKTAKKPSNSSNGETSIFWKPKPGDNKVRILPNPFDPEYPYVEMAFYYFGGKTYLAPSFLGNPDPCVEIYNNFMPKDTDGKFVKIPKDDWIALNNARKKFEPSMAYFLLVLPRGEEAEGPKWWRHTAKVWREVNEQIFLNEDWGDITGLENGNDVTITYTEPKTDGEFPSTKVLPSPKAKPASTDLETLNKQMAEVPSLLTIFKEPTYQELKAVVEAHLKVPTTGDEPITKPQTEQPKVPPVKTEEVKEVEDVFKSILDGIELP